MLRALILRIALLALLFCQWPATAAAAEDDLAARMRAGGHVLMIRHAYAPGVGDPENFTLGDCSTQRNLDGTGRAQARAIGEWLRSRGVESARVHSSQWCRCLETARLMGLGPVAELPALNSFFGRWQERETQLAELRRFLAGLPRDGPLVVLVTHQMTIRGVVDEPTASGEGVLLELQPDGEALPVGRAGFGAR